MTVWTKEERKILRALTTPARVQDYLNSIPFNKEVEGATCLSPRQVMTQKRANCLEGAFFAACALRVHGDEPLLLDLEASGEDDDHVVALFRRRGYWGAISKTNHAVLRYREPIYKTLRELALSYFHEYFLQSNGRKTLRSFSRPVRLSRFDKQEWMTSHEPLWYIRDHLYTISHSPLLSRTQMIGLRKAEKIELEAGKIVEW